MWFEKALKGEPCKIPDEFAFALRTVPKTCIPSLDSYDWIPTSRLYAVYITAWNSTSHQEWDKPLTSRQFGIVARLAFPNAEPVKRRLDGRTVRGLAGVSGPLSVRSVDPCEYYTKRKIPCKKNRALNAKIRGSTPD